MADRKSFLLRVNPRLHAAIERWAADELRSVNAQIEFLLTDAARRAGRLAKDPDTDHERDVHPTATHLSPTDDI